MQKETHEVVAILFVIFCLFSGLISFDKVLGFVYPCTSFCNNVVYHTKVKEFYCCIKMFYITWQAKGNLLALLTSVYLIVFIFFLSEKRYVICHTLAWKFDMHANLEFQFYKQNLKYVTIFHEIIDNMLIKYCKHPKLWILNIFKYSTISNKLETLSDSTTLYVMTFSDDNIRILNITWMLVAREASHRRSWRLPVYAERSKLFVTILVLIKYSTMWYSFFLLL